MTLMRSASRVIAVAALVASAMNCGGGEECSGWACANPVMVSASVPAIDGVWNVTVCLNGGCGAATLTMTQLTATTSPAIAVLQLEATDGAAWRLTARVSVAEPKNGDQISLDVVDATGAKIAQGTASVTYTDGVSDACHECKKATVELP